MQASVTHRIRWPWWLVAVLAVALSAMWWWPSSDEAVVPMPPVAAAPTPVMPPAPKPVPVAAKPIDAALSVSAFKLVGTVVAADGVDSFALMRRAGDSQLLQLRVGGHVEGLTVSAIQPDSVVLAGAGQSVVIETDRTVASPLPSRPAHPPEPDVEPAFAGDPAPFGH